ncbi:hypothetical protein DFQ14_101295 [Halopolyspora algeriensis]|uniref:Uncharacterized protein n=1 Tax=Halopolyspora algeriensis TaxID=1500506 RepID=A0A368VYF6_9ACTN|nr:hypothetical protein [Halopolyspora algeriensis]RCW46955.1 hypothetical protein DFQ14_101295 [Halopolyspora algeriensis]TQM48046.1 hypothetical protein FHU43_2999 [Halopolyspora algeriensis]
MSLTFRSDVSPANWIVDSALPWQRLVGFGPSGFAGYARLRYLPDPAYEGPSENHADVDDDWLDSDHMTTLLQVLASHTTTPDNCYFCVWEGFSDSGKKTLPFEPGEMPEVYRDPDFPPASMPPPTSPARPAQYPGPRSVPPGPQVVVPNRAYFLFHGRLADGHNWDDADLWVGQTRLDAPVPAFVWPADHAWCVASDVDPHWAGIGADTHVIEQLVNDARLDVVCADPDAEQPF